MPFNRIREHFSVSTEMPEHWTIGRSRPLAVWLILNRTAGPLSLYELTVVGLQVSSGQWRSSIEHLNTTTSLQALNSSATKRNAFAGLSLTELMRYLALALHVTPSAIRENALLHKWHYGTSESRIAIAEATLSELWGVVGMWFVVGISR